MAYVVVVVGIMWTLATLANQERRIYTITGLMFYSIGVLFLSYDWPFGFEPAFSRVLTATMAGTALLAIADKLMDIKVLFAYLVSYVFVTAFTNSAMLYHPAFILGGMVVIYFGGKVLSYVRNTRLRLVCAGAVALCVSAAYVAI